MKTLFKIMLLILVPTLLGADGSFDVANWPAVYSVTPAAGGSPVLLQNYTITGSTTAGQTVASYTVPAGVNFYLEYAEAEAYYMTFSTAVANFGPAY